MNFHSFRHVLTGLFLALAGSFLLAGCGGGGATATSQGTTFTILPTTGTAFAGVPFTMSMSGGREPYTLTSSEPSLFAVPLTQRSGTFTVLPANPGVIDAGLAPEDLPVRTVNIEARDASGLRTTAVIKVARNFLTGYGLVLTQTNCPALTSGAANVACAGGTTAAAFHATFAGNLHGDEVFRLEVVRGNFALRNPVTGQVSNVITVNSDHTGIVLGLIEVPANVPRQVAVIRIVHAATGVYADQVFVIDGPAIPGSEPLTPIPSSFTFTGATNVECGTGFGDFFVYGGIPPFNAVSSNPSVLVTPSQSTSQPGRFTVATSNPTICVKDVPVIVTDSLGQRATVTVTTELGSASPPTPPPITVSPGTITLTCGLSGSVSVIGGAGPLSLTSTHPRVTAILSGNTITVTRLTGDAATIYPNTATITVTDGSQIGSLTVTIPANCP